MDWEVGSTRVGLIDGVMERAVVEDKVGAVVVEGAVDDPSDCVGCTVGEGKHTGPTDGLAVTGWLVDSK